MILTPKLTKILFLDIETVPVTDQFELLSPTMQNSWTKKADRLYPESDPEDSFIDKAGIYAEYGKIVCISCSFLYQSDGMYKIRTKSFYGEDEREIIEAFFGLVNQYFYNQFEFFCGHNAKEFDIPFLCRRALINHLHMPTVLQISGKKPWELDFILDTLQFWKFGDYKAYISLDLMHDLLTGSSAKEGMDGSEVSDYYYNRKDFLSIKEYCEEDVQAVIRIYLSLYESYFGEKIEIRNLEE